MVPIAPISPPRRPGFSLVEVLLVVVILGLMMAMALPRITEMKSKSSLRAARQGLSSLFATARAAAVQKGKVATLTMSGTTASVVVLSGLQGQPVTIMGPVRFDQQFGATLAALSAAPMSIRYDARGLVTPSSVAITRYRLNVGTYSDTVCVNGVGLVMLKGCDL